MEIVFFLEIFEFFIWYFFDLEARKESRVNIGNVREDDYICLFYYYYFNLRSIFLNQVLV